MSMSVCLKKAGAAVDYPQKYYATGSALDDKVIELTRIGDFEFKQALTCKAGNVILMDTPVRGGNTRYFIPVFEDVDLSFGKGYSSTLGVTSDSDTRGITVSCYAPFGVTAVGSAYIGCAFGIRITDVGMIGLVSPALLCKNLESIRLGVAFPAYSEFPLPYQLIRFLRIGEETIVAAVIIIPGHLAATTHDIEIFTRLILTT